MFPVNYFIDGYTKTMFPDVEIFLYTFTTNTNSDLAKIDVIYCVMTSVFLPSQWKKSLVGLSDFPDIAGKEWPEYPSIAGPGV